MVVISNQISLEGFLMTALKAFTTNDKRNVMRGAVAGENTKKKS